MIKLSEIPTTAPVHFTKDELKKTTDKLIKRIGQLQHLIYAGQKHAMLVILQGLDASGKDGAARNVFSECNIAGLQLVSFKKPTDEEFAHDFLWRVHKQVPAKGCTTIFNRSHYEDILIQRVHGWITEERVHMRMRAINAFEQLLVEDNHTLLFKFYMHTSKEEQEQQLNERLSDPDKKWKHNAGDWEERKHWDKYMAAYEYAINQSVIPWHIVPVDQRWYRDYVIAKTIVDQLETLNLSLPKVDEPA